MAAIFAQVSRDAVGAGLLAESCRLYGSGSVARTRLTNRGDVIDVDEQTLLLGVHGSVSRPFRRVRPLIHRRADITFAFKLAWRRP
jgi:hypothetical protein